MFGFVSKAVGSVKSWCGKATLALGVGVSALVATSAPAQAQLAIPEAMEPETIANTTLTIVGPFIPTIITIAATLMVGLIVYRVIVRKVHGFGNA